MLAYEEIINYCLNYKMENGKIINKANGNQVLDEEQQLKFKASVAIYMDAKHEHEDQLRMRGKDTTSFGSRIKTSMFKYGINGEVNDHGVNKTIRTMLDSNGHFECNISGNNIYESRFSVITNEFALAIVKLKFMEKGLDFDNLKIRLQEIKDLNNKSTGQFKVVVDYNVKNYDKKENREYQSQLYNSLLVDKTSTSEVSSQKNCKYHYQELIRKIQEIRNKKNLTESEKKQIVNEISYNMGYLIESLTEEDDFRFVLISIFKDLQTDDFESNIRKNILIEMQEKIDKLNKTENEQEESEKIQQADKKEKTRKSK